eukprot:UN09072
MAQQRSESTKQNNHNNKKNACKQQHNKQIDYKTYARNLKGIYIKWSKNPNHIFPDYRQVSGSHVSQKRINVAKQLVSLILRQEQRKIHRAFEEFARKKYRGKKMTLSVNIASAIKRVNTAKVKRDNDYDYGEADDENMWISACQLSDEQLVGTILHEAIHYIATFNGKDICEKDETFVLKTGLVTMSVEKVNEIVRNLFIIL